MLSRYLQAPQMVFHKTCLACQACQVHELHYVARIAGFDLALQQASAHKHPMIKMKGGQNVYVLL